jgi:hypothetical protein
MRPDQSSRTRETSILDGNHFDALIHATAFAAPRRAALAGALGGGLAALLTRAGTEDAAARKKRRKKKGKGGKNPCTAQTGQCLTVITEKCAGQPDPEQCEAEFLPCCEFFATCNTSAALECILKDV